jgi:uncharacterized Ntn-hydrolase superfamily protein
MPTPIREPFAHTYSIVARDPKTGQMGVAVQSHAFSVGSVVTWGEAGVGVVATQSLSRLDYGPEGLTLMRLGVPAPLALETLLRNDERREVRQVAMLDASGKVAAHTGALCIKPAGHLVGDNFSVQANLMRNDTIWGAMDVAYRTASGDLAERLLIALEAAEAAGGDVRGMQSAAILVVAGERGVQSWHGRLLELRVEDHPRPLEELRRLMQFKHVDTVVDEAMEKLIALRKADGKPASGAIAQLQDNLRTALALLPESVEHRFWAAVTLFGGGAEADALPLFREVFAAESFWIDLLPQIAALGLLPNDTAALDRIRAQFRKSQRSIAKPRARARQE